MSKIPIFVTGYPKSGTTWLTRLLGEVLHSPTGGSIPRLDSTEIATEGQDRISPNIIRKGHFVIREKPHDERGRRAHTLSENDIKIYQIVHIIRDPRDIIASASHYWDLSPKQIFLNMTKGIGNFRLCGPWTSYIWSWLDAEPKVLTIRYEDLLTEGTVTIAKVLCSFGLDPGNYDIETACDNQKFSSRVAHIEEFGEQYIFGKEFNRTFMRRGAKGDWRNCFDNLLAFETEASFGGLLRKFKYETSSNWWVDYEQSKSNSIHQR